jgi:hypothetical protein
LSPTVHRENGYRFWFWSNENNEPMHVHVEKAEKSAKFLMKPTIQLVENYGFASGELGWIEQVIHQQTKKIERKWHDHFRSRRR